MDIDEEFVLDSEEIKVEVPLSLMESFLSKLEELSLGMEDCQRQLGELRAIREGVDQLNANVQKLATQFKDFEGIQGARDQVHTKRSESVLVAISGVAEEFQLPVNTLEDLNVLEKRLENNLAAEKLKLHARKMKKQSLRLLMSEELLTKFSKAGRDKLLKIQSSRFLSIVLEAWTKDGDIETVIKAMDDEMNAVRKCIYNRAYHLKKQQPAGEPEKNPAETK